MSKININNKVVNFGWIVGERKLVKVGTKMPSGWTKIGSYILPNQSQSISLNTSTGTITHQDIQNVLGDFKLHYKGKTYSKELFAIYTNGDTVNGYNDINDAINAGGRDAANFYIDDVNGMTKTFLTSTSIPTQNLSGEVMELWEYKGEQK